MRDRTEFGERMNRKDIVTDEHFYITDGGKVHFFYDDDEDGYFLCDEILATNINSGDKYVEHNSKNITEFYIPNTINGKPVIGVDDGTFDNMNKLSAFIVEEDNKYFRLYQGGLFSKDMKEIFSMPPSYQKKEFCVPDGVERIRDSALSNSYIETLILPKGCKDIDQYGVSGSGKLKKIFIPKSIKWIGLKAFIMTPLEDIYYEGSEADKNKIKNVVELDCVNAKWHYDCDFYD